jgi:hypothetical protein
MVAAERQGSYAELSRLGWPSRHLQKGGSLASTCGTGIVPATTSHRGASSAYRRGQTISGRGIPSLVGFVSRRITSLYPSPGSLSARSRSTNAGSSQICICPSELLDVGA